MILRRYINIEILLTTVTIIAILLAITLSSWLVKYVALAAAGKLPIAALFKIILFQIPEFIIYILPLGFFIGCLLSFSRLYVDHEMAILRASGLGLLGILKLAWPVIAIATVFQALICGYFGPAGGRASDQLVSDQLGSNFVSLLKAKEFVQVGQYTVYVETIDKTNWRINHIFVHQQGNKQQTIVYAESARQLQDPQSPNMVIELTKGRRYSLDKTNGATVHAEFERYQLIIERSKDKRNTKPEKMTWQELLEAKTPKAIAEMGFRLSMPWMMVVAALFALIMAPVQPRQGRYAKLLPSLLLYACSIVLLIAMQQQVGKNKLPVAYCGVLISIYIASALFIISEGQWRHWLPSLRARK